MTNKPDLCIFHGNCADGFTAAWSVWKKFGDDVEYFGATHGNPPPDVTGKSVVIVDFSYPYDVIVEMSFKAKSIVILDHHKTAKEALERLPIFRCDAPNAVEEAFFYCYTCNMPSIAAAFDMEKSGARMAWEHFHGGDAPNLVKYVEDRDLWRFKLHGSRAVAAFVFSYEYTFKNWNFLHAMLGMRLDDPMIQTAIDAGDAIERKHHKDIAELLAVTRRKMVIGGHVVPVANLPYTMASDAAHALCAPCDDGLNGSWIPAFAACYFDRNDGTRVFSLRSRGDDGADVSAIAKTYGGGGHRNAAGFQMPGGWEGDAA